MPHRPDPSRPANQDLTDDEISAILRGETQPAPAGRQVPARPGKDPAARARKRAPIHPATDGRIVKLANCNDHPRLADPTLPCWALRNDDGTRVTPEQTFALIEALPDLRPIIAWLENGCDTKDAITDLCVLQLRIDKARAR